MFDLGKWLRDANRGFGVLTGQRPVQQPVRQPQQNPQQNPQAFAQQQTQQQAAYDQRVKQKPQPTFVEKAVRTLAPVTISGLNTANLIGSGFNQKEAYKKNADFLGSMGLRPDIAKDVSNSLITPDKIKQTVIDPIVNDAKNYVAQAKVVNKARLNGADPNQLAYGTDAMKAFGGKPDRTNQAVKKAETQTRIKVAPVDERTRLAASNFSLVAPIGKTTQVLGQKAAPKVAEVVNEARPSVMATKHPEVAKFDDTYNQLAQQFDNTPDPVVRREISQAMAQNRQERLLKRRAIEQQISQAGFAKIPGSNRPIQKLDQTSPSDLSRSQAPLVQRPQTSLQPSLTSEQMTSRTPLNVAKYNIDDAGRQELQRTVEELAPVLDKKVGSRLSLQEAQAAADQTTDLLRSAKTREQTAKSVAAMQNARQKISLYAERRANGESLTPIEQDEFVKLTINVKSTQADLARQLGSLRNSVDPRTKTLIDVVLEKLAQKGHDVDELTRAASQYDLSNPKQLAEFYRKFEKATAEDWLDKLRYNSMLSSPLTHSRNVSSSAMGATLVSPVQKLTEGVVDATRAALTGGPRTRFAGESKEYVKGLGQSLGTAKQAFVDSYKGNTVDRGGADVDQLFNIPLAQGGFKGMVDSVLGFTTKLMEATDQAGLALVRGGETKALNYRVSKGVDVKDIGLAADKAAEYRLFRQDLGGDEQGKLLQALDYIPMKVSEARNTNNGVVRTMAKLTFPFVKTPTNVAKQLIEYSPLGLATTWKNGDKTAQIAKAVMGTAATATVAGTLAANDALTFGLPAIPSERDKFLAEGKQPYSFKIGDKWISYQYLHPAISFNMAAVASVNEALRNKDIDEGTGQALMEGLAGVSRFFVDQSYFKNAQDFLSNMSSDGFQSPAATGAIYANNVVSQFIPFRAAATWVKNMIDPTQRKVDTAAGVIEQFRQNFAKQLPGLSGSVEGTYKDALGNEVKNTDVLINAISPARIKTDKPGAAVGDDPLSKEINRLYQNDEGIKLTSVGSKVTFNGIDTALDSDQSKQLTENINTTTKSLWDQAVQSEKFKSLPDDDKRKALSSIKSDVTAAMKDRFAQDFSYGKYSVDYNGEDSKLTSKQRAIAGSNPDINRYLKSGGGSSTTVSENLNKDSASVIDKYDSLDEKGRKDWFAKEYDAEFKYSKAKYENDKASGKLSKIDDIRAQKALRKAEVGSKVSKDTRDLYGMSKAEVLAYIQSDPDGNRLAKELNDYDQALFDAGLISTKKFRYGFGNAKKASSGKKKSGGRKGKGGKGIKFPSTNPSFAAQTDTLKTLSSLLRGTTVKKATVPRTGRGKANIKKITVKA